MSPGHADVNELARLYVDEHLSLREIRDRTGVPINRVSELLRDSGVRLRKRGSRAPERLDPKRLRAAYEAGASLRELALDEGTDDRFIRQALVAAGAEIRRSGGHHRWDRVMTADWLDEQYVAGGRSARSLAAELGCEPETVLKALRRHGFPVRPR